MLSDHETGLSKPRVILNMCKRMVFLEVLGHSWADFIRSQFELYDTTAMLGIWSPNVEAPSDLRRFRFPGSAALGVSSDPGDMCTEVEETLRRVQIPGPPKCPKQWRLDLKRPSTQYLTSLLSKTIPLVVF